MKDPLLKDGLLRALAATATRRRLLYALAGALVLCLAVSGWVVHRAHDFLTTPPEVPGREVVLDIAPGSSFDQVAATLRAKNLITDTDKFRMLGRWEDKIASIKAGEFLLNTNWRPLQILDVITSGRAVLHRLFVPEGLTWWQIGRLVEKEGLADFESFERAVHDRELLDRFQIPFADAEGFLFPNTYLLPRPRGGDAAPVVRTMLSAFFEHAAERLWPDGPPEPAEMRRIVTLASMVEKEVGVDAERERIAGVYANRLKKRMLLQCDPTVIYGLGTAFDGNLTRAHLRDKANPYNTYRHRGLPPGPICSPGFRSLEAAMAPEKNSFLYFVAKGDGTHHFSRSLAEHNRAVRIYQLRR
ncbi:endolytic transglycosylase MltG [Desulfocurvus sp. DL9XJH121]